MIKEKTLKRPMVSFVILSNIIFLPLFSLIGLTRMLGLPSIICDIVFCISAWSSTFASLILFNRIYPGQNFIEYVKDKFKIKLKLSVIILAIIIPVLIFVVTVFMVSFKNNGGVSIFAISSFGMLIYSFFKNLLAGPLGEELSWRGYALNELQKKHSSLVSALIVGALWAFWHTPIWLVSAYIGVNLIKYCVFFIIAVISVSIIMTAFYNLNKNLLIPIIIHQLWNFLISIINGNFLDIIMYCAILYFVVAIILIVINPKKVLYGKKCIYKNNYIKFL